MTTQRKPKVLFLCTGNSARSQMAEAFVRLYAGNWLEPHSAGLEPRGLHPYTIQAMAELGIDISGQRSKSVREYLGRESFRYLVTVCQHAEEHCPTAFIGYGTKLHWPLDDPAAFVGTDSERLAAFRAVRDQIQARVKGWLAEVWHDPEIQAWLAAQVND